MWIGYFAPHLHKTIGVHVTNLARGVVAELAVVPRAPTKLIEEHGIFATQLVVELTTDAFMENPLETGPVDLRKVVHPSYCTSDMLKCSSFFL